MLSESERQVVEELLSKPMEFPDEFKSWIIDYIAMNIPLLPLNQVLGWQVQQAHYADQIVTEEASSTTAYADLATVGPTITGISDGLYAVLFGAYVVTDTHVPGAPDFGNLAYMSISINGAAPDDSEAAVANNLVQVSKGAMHELSNNDNSTITAKYKNSKAFSTTWRRRWMIALRVLRHS